MVFVKSNAYICTQRVLNFKTMHMNIKLYSLKSMTRWEVFQLLDDVLTVCDKHGEGMPQSFADKVESFRKAFEIYDEEIVQARKFATRDLQKADEERDYAIRKIYQLIRYYSDYRFDPEKEVAAKALKRIFKSYGTGSKIARQSQDTQTAMIINLLQVFSNDLPKQYIATLRLTDAVSALETSNQVFAKEQSSRYKFKSEYVKGVAKSARTDVQNEFMELVALINSLAVVEGQEKYADLKRIINELVRKYVAQVRLRTRKKEVEE